MHLTTHRKLQEIADQEWVVTTRMRAKVLKRINSSLHAWGSATKLQEFSIERTGERGMFRVVRLQCPVTNLTALLEAGHQVSF